MKSEFYEAWTVLSLHPIGKRRTKSRIKKTTKRECLSFSNPAVTAVCDSEKISSRKATCIVAVTAYALGKGGQDWKFCRINHFHIHKYKWILVLNDSIHERNMQLKCYSCEDHFVYQEPEEIKTIWM